MSNKLFQIYLMQKRDEMRRRDKSFVLKDNTDFIKKCREDWKSMTEIQRNVFDACLQDKRHHQMGNNSSGSQTKSQKKMIDPYVEDTQQSIIEEEIGLKLIEFMVRQKSKQDLMSTKFYFMSSNVLCKCEDKYIPLEIGLVEYTIGDGILNTYHKFIDFGAIPLGYTYYAKNHSENYHKIPIFDFFMASKDYKQIMNDIQEFFTDSRLNIDFAVNFNPIIVFTNEDQVEQNTGVIQWLSDKCNEQLMKMGNDMNIRILNVADLVNQIFKELNIKKPLAIIADDLTSNAFNYSPNTDCQFHDEIQCILCAIGVSKRLSYNISNLFQPIFEFEITDQHFPRVIRKRNNDYLNLRKVKKIKSEPNLIHEQLPKDIPKYVGIGRGRLPVRRTDRYFEN